MRECCVLFWRSTGPPLSPNPAKVDVSDPDDRRYFRTLRGFLEGEEPDEETYFAYSATLRIFGNIPDLDEITRQLGVQPTNAYRKGDRRVPEAPPYEQDMWRYSPPIPESEQLSIHIDALWNQIRAHKKYLLELKKSLTVDVFLGYRSNCDHAGVAVPHTSLEMFRELEIPFELSIIT